MSSERAVVRHHAEWLGLLDISGPFLALPTLLRVFPQGLDDFDPGRAAVLHDYYIQWLAEDDIAIHRAFIVEVLRLALDLTPPELLTGAAIPVALQAPVGVGEVLRPDFVLAPGTIPTLLVQVYPREQALEREVSARASTSPADRMRVLLRHTGTPLGLLTNGESWMLVFAPPEGVVTYVTFSADLWFEEPVTLRAFASLLGLRRFIGVDPGETLLHLLRTCADDQHALTDQLGAQVRRAADVLLQTLGRVDRDRHGKLLEGVPPTQIYAGVVTVMMRLIFLLSAEENDLLLRGEALYDDNYAISTLHDQLQEQADRHSESILEFRYDAWSRLLATFRAVEAGMGHDRLRMPAYGGTLFKPDAYPFLEGRAAGSALAEADPPRIDNRTVLHLLSALQRLEVPLPGGAAESRRLSYRGLGVENIGQVYEGLLDHTAGRAAGPVLGLRGARQRDLEFDLELLESLAGDPDDPGALVSFVAEQTGRSADALRRALAEPVTADDERALVSACEGDSSLAERARPFAGLLRRDSRGLPVVHPAGTLYMKQGTDRRASGTHYTRPELSAPVVEHTLAPLVYRGPAEGRPRDQWQLRRAREILQLKVCDPAMGSGAFLVQACRYLGARLVEAWNLAEEVADGRPVVTPEGECATSDHRQEIIPRDPHLRDLFARRIVADRCLHGIDKNPLAVEMAKLSLWLDTMQRDRAFSFLDHALRRGDSLLGVHDIRQLEHLSIDPRPGRQGHALRVQQKDIAALVRRTLESAGKLREQLESFPVIDIHDSDRKDVLYRQAEAALDADRLLADLLVGTALATASRPKKREQAFTLLALRITDAFSEQGDPTLRTTALAELRVMAKVRLADPHGDTPRDPLHWLLAFPEVFAFRDDRSPGFDAFVGNPPFQGGQKITGTLGTDYRTHLVLDLADDRRGSADLCAYFFLRAAKLLREPGQIGFVATNTIAQGDTREVGLDALVADHLTIARAVASMPWPGDASLEISQVWLRRGPWHGEVVLDDQPVRAISPALTVPGGTTGKPHRLKANEGRSFIGSYVLGMGFILTPAEAQELVDRDPKNKDVLFPYLNGEDLNSTLDQSATRWVINFQDWPLSRETAATGYVGPVAADYPDCLEIVEQKVKPERDRLMKGDATARDRARRWWQFGRPTQALYWAIRRCPRVLAISLVTNHIPVGRAPTGQIFAHKLVVFPSSNLALCALLQSSVHYHWAWANSSTMRTDINYSPSDCFETFPFPILPRWNLYPPRPRFRVRSLRPATRQRRQDRSILRSRPRQRRCYDPRHRPSPRAMLAITELELLGIAYDAHRRTVMQAAKKGLTKTYNRFHDPAEHDSAVVELRRLHVELDHAIVRAYGWHDLLPVLGHDFHPTKQGTRFTVSDAARREILDRLLTLNHERHAEEVEVGLHRKAEGPWYLRAEKHPRKPRKTKPTKSAAADATSPGPAKKARRGKRPVEPAVNDTPLLDRLLAPVEPTVPPVNTPQPARPARVRKQAEAPALSLFDRLPEPQPTASDRTATTILAALRGTDSSLTLADLCAATGLAEPAVAAALAELQSSNTIAHKGRGAKTRYRPQ